MVASLKRYDNVTFMPGVWWFVEQLFSEILKKTLKRIKNDQKTEKKVKFV